MRKVVAALALVATLVPAAAQAELREIRQTIYGMDWAVCAHALSVALKKLEGVEGVTVSLNEGLATLALKPGNKATLEQVREAVRRNGFTPKGADIRVSGTLVERGGKAALAVTGLELVYLPRAKGKVSELARTGKDRPVVVVGHVPESTAKAPANASAVLQVREFTFPSN